jgi:response regulator of citrate/malate metabolism
MIRIIIVEDDPMVAQLNAAYLERLEGFCVVGQFSNGQEALEYLRENPVELAIVDVYMPVCSGIELLRKLRSEWNRTAVIMITAATEMNVVDEALHLGIEDYIIKPFAYERLRESVLRFRDKTSLVQESGTVSQDVVDRLLGNQTRPRPGSSLPKGLNPRTMAAIRTVLEQGSGSIHTCESISAASGLSRVTVRHYLNYLIDVGELVSSIDYETGGRPRVLYRVN